MGFVSETELIKIAKQTDIFVNPRPSHIPENAQNFPSKLLEYLAFGKPVVSTWTAGLSEEYKGLLVLLARETEECLINTLEDVLSWTSYQNKNFAIKCEEFVKSKSWARQAEKMSLWLEESKCLWE